MRALQSRPYVVKTIHLAKQRTLAKLFHRSAGTGTGNAAIADTRQAAAVVIFLPVSIVPGSIGEISANCTREIMVWPMKTTSPGCALTPSRILLECVLAFAEIFHSTLLLQVTYKGIPYRYIGKCPQRFCEYLHESRRQAPCYGKLAALEQRPAKIIPACALFFMPAAAPSCAARGSEDISGCPLRPSRTSTSFPAPTARPPAAWCRHS